MLFFNWTPLAPGLASFCLFSVFSAHIILKQINVKNHLEFELTTSCKSFSSNNNRPPIISMEIYLRKVKTKRRVFSELNNLKIVLEKFTILTLNHWDFWPLGTVWLDGQIIFQYLATCNKGKLPNRIKKIAKLSSKILPNVQNSSFQIFVFLGFMNKDLVVDPIYYNVTLPGSIWSTRVSTSVLGIPSRDQ